MGFFANLLAVASLLAVAHAVPLNNQKLFGHSVKNGPLPVNTEVVAFEHTCESPPCVITQIHCPSIYPGHGDEWDWTDGSLSFYIDSDESDPTIRISLAELGGEGRFAQSESHY